MKKKIFVIYIKRKKRNSFRLVRYEVTEVPEFRDFY